MQTSEVQMNEYYSNPFANDENDSDADVNENNMNNHDDINDNHEKYMYDAGNKRMHNRNAREEDTDAAYYAEIDMEENEREDEIEVDKQPRHMQSKTQIDLSADDNSNLTFHSNNAEHVAYSGLSGKRSSYEASIIARFKAALDEEVANATAMREEYEKHIELLRSNVEQLTNENDHLQSTCMKLESQLRSMSLEKDNAEWVQEQQSNRSAALERRVEELECELEQTQIRARDMVHEIESTYKNQHLERRPQSQLITYNNKDNKGINLQNNNRISKSLDRVESVESYYDGKTIRLSGEGKKTENLSLSLKQREVEEQKQLKFQQSNEKAGLHNIDNIATTKYSIGDKHTSNATVRRYSSQSDKELSLSSKKHDVCDALTKKTNALVISQSGDKKVTSNTELDVEMTDANANNANVITSIIDHNKVLQRRRASTPPWLPASKRQENETDDANMNSVRASRRGLNPDKTAWMTDEEKEEQRARERVVVDRLEADLLEHSKIRDELVSQLQRLESSRLKTVAERAKKAAVECDLSTEEHVIGKLRLQLRSYSSLIK